MVEMWKRDDILPPVVGGTGQESQVIRITTWNAGAMSGKQDGTIKWMYESGINIACFQELWYSPSQLERFRLTAKDLGYAMVTGRPQMDRTDRTWRGGLAIVADRELRKIDLGKRMGAFI